ncbi:2-succinyl-6-hydroxy-2,4-cyclohexadiene-1-carboxylate synthase [Lactobacillus sp. CC-MHH1034]|uniref:2-succinyl-6-hydroxy-2, 4-cyclohexadiene-1-carboxylate synthase n=1 Tax=Agrilactobacillus fermenti TaxID=2586909 RepID=UPI001E3AD182|nr:2-succinyl-6-hydroxy-2,4-cyclohexadiene-1-carboxylate synthase [Agrilactobacillus fermenti]MCD2257357.1 2-succinyl-6-hydroxy-2,4-cyclohexadiene-1-carboxylate synthase [Agrilactobacillus fermenti]
MQISVNDANYKIQKIGHGAPYWLILHGFMGNHHEFETIATKLPGTKLLPDLLGHGGTTATKQHAFTMTQQVIDLMMLTTQLVPDQRLNVLGYSMGGRIAVAFANTHPERIQTLFLESTRPGIATQKQRDIRRQHDQVLAKRLLTHGLHDFVNYWTELPLFASQKRLPQAVQQRVKAMRLHQRADLLARSLTEMGTGSQANYWPDLIKLTQPTHLIVGALDRKFTDINTKMVRQLPNVTLTKIPNAGHNSHLEAPNTFIKAVLKELTDYAFD